MKERTEHGIYKCCKTVNLIVLIRVSSATLKTLEFSSRTVDLTQHKLFGGTSHI